MKPKFFQLRDSLYINTSQIIDVVIDSYIGQPTLKIFTPSTLNGKGDDESDFYEIDDRDTISNLLSELGIKYPLR